MQNQCGTSNGRGGANPQSRRRAPSFPLPLSPFALQPSRRRRAVTLIELLITMTIMAIISAAILGTAAAAIESSREKKTQSLITKIHTLLMERYASYETRRVELDQRWITNLDGLNPTLRGQALADLRLLGLRELMKYEMPDRWSDAIGAKLGQSPVRPVFLSQLPPLAQTYIRRSQNATDENEGAECLYLTIMMTTADGEARSLFNKQDIGDTDNDGAPEFLDGWGKPITYLRWAPGYFPRSSLVSGDGANDHDPFDPYQRDQPGAIPASYSGSLSGLQNYVIGLRDQYPAFRLMPLVISAGPDGEYDILTSRDKVVNVVGANEISFNPYFIDSSLTPIVSGMPTYGLGMPDISDNTDTTKDNITNHDVQY
ncbi:type II secretion system protein [Lacipirellula limnantheis]|uniref:Uncharacterized protein n=1 Tax=Lacipirellula limnantheis TaxID=2528024 RepID=A0A517TVY7_9BACT|nr:prepilin-type N-terminal cleavage/methylation domain-containing protein [Lacipirellula limnantheis]QDT72544.1 hypothetical protein I41_17240 [Lacipirellula limnantheis]